MLTFAQHQALSPIEKFKENLKNSLDMRDRKESINYLAHDLRDLPKAREIAREHGLTNPYYFN